MLQLDGSLRSQALAPVMITERNKFIENLKQTIFKQAWTETNLFFTIPFARIVPYIRSTYQNVSAS